MTILLRSIFPADAILTVCLSLSGPYSVPNSLCLSPTQSHSFPAEAHLTRKTSAANKLIESWLRQLLLFLPFSPLLLLLVVVVVVVIVSCYCNSILINIFLESFELTTLLLKELHLSLVKLLVVVVVVVCLLLFAVVVCLLLLFACCFCCSFEGRPSSFPIDMHVEKANLLYYYQSGLATPGSKHRIIGLELKRRDTFL